MDSVSVDDLDASLVAVSEMIIPNLDGAQSIHMLSVALVGENDEDYKAKSWAGGIFVEDGKRCQGCMAGHLCKEFMVLLDEGEDVQTLCSMSCPFAKLGISEEAMEALNQIVMDNDGPQGAVGDGRIIFNDLSETELLDFGEDLPDMSEFEDDSFAEEDLGDEEDEGLEPEAERESGPEVAMVQEQKDVDGVSDGEELTPAEMIREMDRLEKIDRPESQESDGVPVEPQTDQSEAEPETSDKEPDQGTVGVQSEPEPDQSEAEPDTPDDGSDQETVGVQAEPDQANEPEAEAGAEEEPEDKEGSYIAVGNDQEQVLDGDYKNMRQSFMGLVAQAKKDGHDINLFAVREGPKREMVMSFDSESGKLFGLEGKELRETSRVGEPGQDEPEEPEGDSGMDKSYRNRSQPHFQFCSKDEVLLDKPRKMSKMDVLDTGIAEAKKLGGIVEVWKYQARKAKGTKYTFLYSVDPEGNVAETPPVGPDLNRLDLARSRKKKGVPKAGKKRTWSRLPRMELRSKTLGSRHLEKMPESKALDLAQKRANEKREFVSVYKWTKNAEQGERIAVARPRGKMPPKKRTAPAKPTSGRQDSSMVTDLVRSASDIYQNIIAGRDGSGMQVFKEAPKSGDSFFYREQVGPESIIRGFATAEELAEEIEKADRKPIPSKIVGRALTRKESNAVKNWLMASHIKAQEPIV